MTSIYAAQCDVCLHGVNKVCDYCFRCEACCEAALDPYENEQYTLLLCPDCLAKTEDRETWRCSVCNQIFDGDPKVSDVGMCTSCYGHYVWLNWKMAECKEDDWNF